MASLQPDATYCRCMFLPKGLIMAEFSPVGNLEQLQGSAKLCLLSWAVRKLLPRQYFLCNISNFQIFMHMSGTHVILTWEMLCEFSQCSKHADKRQIQQDFLQKLKENIQDFSLQRIVWKSLGQVCKCVCVWHWTWQWSHWFLLGSDSITLV